MNKTRRSLLAAGAVGLAGPRFVAAAPPASRTATVGILMVGNSEESARSLARFKAGMAQRGYVDGRTLTIEPRFGENSTLPALAAELVAKKVDVIVTLGTPPAVAAKRATASIPIIAVNITNPVRDGLAAHVVRPGGNLTGVVNAADDIVIKRIEVLLSIAPGIRRVGWLVNPDNPAHVNATGPTRAAAALKFESVLIWVRRQEEIQAALTVRKDFDAFTLGQDPLFNNSFSHIAEIALAHRLPSVAQLRGYVAAGGLASYGQDFDELWHIGADYVDKVLNGAKPAELPFYEASQFDFGLNQKAARALGLTIPEALLLKAQYVVS